eukprot:COSAG06_NODE_12508_length_1372_cov_1.266300_1_plen_128_part_00
MCLLFTVHELDEWHPILRREIVWDHDPTRVSPVPRLRAMLPERSVFPRAATSNGHRCERCDHCAQGWARPVVCPGIDLEADEVLDVECDRGEAQVERSQHGGAVDRQLLLGQDSRTSSDRATCIEKP